MVIPRRCFDHSSSVKTLRNYVLLPVERCRHYNTQRAYGASAHFISRVISALVELDACTAAPEASRQERGLFLVAAPYIESMCEAKQNGMHLPREKTGARWTERQEVKWQMG